MSAVKNIINGSLKSKLVELIRLRGPLSVHDYMKIVLTNPESGFYMNKDVFGVKGHFTTNPEISQIFGELLGVWILQEWKRFKYPKPLQLVEFGPGRGTLMSDIARTLGKLGHSHDIEIKFIELSPKLKEIQRETLSERFSRIDKIKWYPQVDSIEANPGGFTAFIAHEYLDAIPIFKFVRDPNTNAMRELLIDYDQNQNLRFCIARQPSLPTRLLVPEGFQGDHIEICPDAAVQLQKVAAKLEQSGQGCMLVCDYGFEIEKNSNGEGDITVSKPIQSARDTFRAFKNHQPYPPLRDPGEADLTADVDFGYLKEKLKDKALLFGSVTQEKFLQECGIHARLGVLLEKSTDDERENLISGARMMLEDMGQRYRFLSFFPKGAEPLFVDDAPAGFHTSE